jgi:hypothetical protein
LIRALPLLLVLSACATTPTQPPAAKPQPVNPEVAWLAVQLGNPDHAAGLEAIRKWAAETESPLILWVLPLYSPDELGPLELMLPRGSRSVPPRWCFEWQGCSRWARHYLRPESTDMEHALWLLAMECVNGADEACAGVSEILVRGPADWRDLDRAERILVHCCKRNVGGACVELGKLKMSPTP